MYQWAEWAAKEFQLSSLNLQGFRSLSGQQLSSLSLSELEARASAEHGNTLYHFLHAIKSLSSVPPPDFSSTVSGGSFPNFELPFEQVPPIMSEGSLSSPAQAPTIAIHNPMMPMMMDDFSMQYMSQAFHHNAPNQLLLPPPPLLTPASQPPLRHPLLIPHQFPSTLPLPLPRTLSWCLTPTSFFLPLQIWTDRHRAGLTLCWVSYPTSALAGRDPHSDGGRKEDFCARIQRRVSH